MREKKYKPGDVITFKKVVDRSVVVDGVRGPVLPEVGMRFNLRGDNRIEVLEIGDVSRIGDRGRWVVGVMGRIVEKRLKIE